MVRTVMAAGRMALLWGLMITALPVDSAANIFLVVMVGGLAGFFGAQSVGVSGSAGVGLGMLLASFSYSARRIFGAVPGARETAGQIALGVGTVLVPGVLVLALGALARVLPG